MYEAGKPSSAKVLTIRLGVLVFTSRSPTVLQITLKKKITGFESPTLDLLLVLLSNFSRIPAAELTDFFVAAG